MTSKNILAHLGQFLVLAHVQDQLIACVADSLQPNDDGLPSQISPWFDSVTAFDLANDYEQGRKVAPTLNDVLDWYNTQYDNTQFDATRRVLESINNPHDELVDVLLDAAWELSYIMVGMELPTQYRLATRRIFGQVALSSNAAALQATWDFLTAFADTGIILAEII